MQTLLQILQWITRLQIHPQVILALRVLKLIAQTLLCNSDVAVRHLRIQPFETVCCTSARYKSLSA